MAPLVVRALLLRIGVLLAVVLLCVRVLAAGPAALAAAALYALFAPLTDWRAGIRPRFAGSCDDCGADPMDPAIRRWLVRRVAHVVVLLSLLRALAAAGAVLVVARMPVVAAAWCIVVALWLPVLEGAVIARGGLRGWVRADEPSEGTG